MSWPITPTTRRDFLYTATASAAAVTVFAGVWGLGRSMLTAPTTEELLSVDLANIPEGTQLTVAYRRKPIFIRHRTPAEIAEAEAVELADLVDTLAQNQNLGSLALAHDINRRATPDGRFLILLGVCPHEGCLPLGDGAGDFGGWFCPCCAAHFDTAGRVRKGPSPLNMAIPPYLLDEDDRLVLLPTAALNPRRLDSLIYG